jgi:hypothetical protein
MKSGARKLVIKNPTQCECRHAYSGLYRVWLSANGYLISPLGNYIPPQSFHRVQPLLPLADKDVVGFSGHFHAFGCHLAQNSNRNTWSGEGVSHDKVVSNT